MKRSQSHAQCPGEDCQLSWVASQVDQDFDKMKHGVGVARQACWPHIGRLSATCCTPIPETGTRFRWREDEIVWQTVVSRA
jgi:hypothetical protein